MVSSPISNELVFPEITPQGHFPLNRSFSYIPIYVPNKWNRQAGQNYLLNELSDYVKKFGNLPINWAGEGTEAVSGIVINNVLNFLTQIGEDYLGHLCQHSIVPTPYGTVNLDWQNSNGSVSVEVGKSRMAFVAEIANNPPLYYNDLLIKGDVSRNNHLIYKYLRQLFNGNKTNSKNNN